MISHKYSCIFIHIPKCAGTSVDSLLLGSGKPLDRFDSKNNIWLQHATAKEVKKNYCTEKQFKEYFKFTIVRNPFDRIVSSFNWLGGDLNNKKEFKDFILRRGRFKEILNSKTYIKSNMYHQIMPAYKYLFENNKLIVDFVGKFENLISDWDYICKKLGTSLKLPYINRMPHKHYKEVFNKDARKIIENLYKDDLKLFSYKF